MGELQGRESQILFWRAKQSTLFKQRQGASSLAEYPPDSEDSDHESFATSLLSQTVRTRFDP